MRLRLALLLFAVSGLFGTAAHAQRADAREALGAATRSFFDGDVRAARIQLLNATKADPGWALPHALQARVYLALGDGEAAEAELGRAVASGMKPDRLSHLLAEAHLLQGQPQKALAEAALPLASSVSRAYATRIAGRAAMALGDFEGAARAFDAALAMTPRSAALWADIGRFRLVSGNIGGAVVATQTALQINPRNVDAIMLMGQLVRGQYGLLAAIPWYDKVLEIDPNNLAALGEAAATLGDAGRAGEMLALTRRMLEVDPGNARAYYLQAVMAARAGNAELSRSLVYRVRGRMDDVPGMMLLQSVLEMTGGSAEQAALKLERLVKLQPANLTARRLWGAALWQSGDNAGAVVALEPLTRRSDADSYSLTLIGRALEAVGNREAAAGFLDRAAQPYRGEPGAFDLPDPARGTGPDRADVLIPRIARAVGSGQAGSVLAEAERLRNANPGAPAAHVVVGDVLMALGRPADAAEAYRAAANIAFTEATALRLVAALQKAGRADAAIRVLDLYLSQNPRSVPALALAGDHFLAVGDWARAVDTLEKLRYRIGNRDAALLASLGWASFNVGDAERATAYAQAAYAIAPRNPAVANAAGWILFKTGTDKAQGLALLRKAVGIAPDKPGLRFQFAQALAETGDRRRAKAELQAALADPGFTERKQAAVLLAKL